MTGFADETEDDLNNPESDEVRLPATNKAMRMATLAVVISVICSIALIAVFTIQVTKADPKPIWNPLGDFPVQRVNNTLPGFTTPAMKVGDDAVVEGTKCNATDQSVTVRGKNHWVSVDPNGSVSSYKFGQSILLPGCTRTTFANPMPPEVVDRVNRLCTVSHRCATVWRVAGETTPVDSHGVEGRERVWLSGNFTIVDN